MDNAALKISGIRYLQIEQAPEGVGGWKLGGIRVWANDRLISREDPIRQWLERNNCTWRTHNFTPTSGEVPLEIAPYEEDSLLYGADEHCDTPAHAPKNARLLFNTGPWTFRGDYVGRFAGSAEGADRYGRRVLDDSSQARYRFWLDLITPEAAQSNLVAFGSQPR